MLRRTAVFAAIALAAGCTAAEPAASTPGLAERDTAMTTAALTKQDLTAKVSLTGKVELNPVYGLAAPLDGQVRYLTPPDGVVTRKTRVANLWADGAPTRVEIPEGAEFAGRLVPDKANVVKGTPVVSVRHGGYAIAADIDGKQAYSISKGLTSVRVQIEGGPGPFACPVLGTIAALPPGTIPAPPEPVEPVAPPDATAPPVTHPRAEPEPVAEPSAPTGMRLICTAPAGTTLINGAAATVEVITARAKQVLVAPVEAVAGSQGKGQVDVIGPDGARVTKQVVLGLSDGKVIEIKSGLTGTEKLAIPGPTLAAPEPAPQTGP